MRVTFSNDGSLQIDDARLVYRNFSGNNGFNEGDRDFGVIIPNSEIADALIENGWNVTIKQPRQEGDSPFMFMKVKFKIRYYGNGPDREMTPCVYLVSGNNRRRVNDEESLDNLDYIKIDHVDMDLAPYDWSHKGMSGRTAYLSAIEVVQKVDRFAARFAEEEAPEEVPF